MLGNFMFKKCSDRKVSVGFPLFVWYQGLNSLCIENEETPDLVCLQLGICNNATCHLFPYPSKMTPFMKAFPSFTAYEMPQPSRLHERQARAGFDPLQWLWDKLSTIVNSHLPLVDLDGDKFSSKILHTYIIMLHLKSYWKTCFQSCTNHNHCNLFLWWAAYWYVLIRCGHLQRL